MSFRFWEAVESPAPSSIYLCRSGVELKIKSSAGRVTLGPRGTRVTAALPGSGLYYTERGPKPRAGDPPGPAPSAKERAKKSQFSAAKADDHHRTLLAGLTALHEGRTADGIAEFKQILHIPDAAYLAGISCFAEGDLPSAQALLLTARQRFRDLGTELQQYDLVLYLSVPVSNELSLLVTCDLKGLDMLLSEVYHRQGNADQRLAMLESAQRNDPKDAALRCALAQVYWEQEMHRRIIDLCRNVENANALESGCVYFYALALEAMRLQEAALDVLTRAVRRKKDRPERLMRAMHYHRAVLCEHQGDEKNYHKELSWLKAEAPQYQDVPERLRATGLS